MPTPDLFMAIETRVPFVAQRSPEFAAWSLPDGSTNLCGPVAIAHRVLAARRVAPGGLSHVRVWTSTGPVDDPLPFIHHLASICRTRKLTGTNEFDFLDCIESSFRLSGAAAAGARVVSLSARESLSQSEVTRWDPRSHAVFLFFRELRVRPPSRVPTFGKGHFVTAYGVEVRQGGGFDFVIFDPDPPPGEEDLKLLRVASAEPFVPEPWMTFDDASTSKPSFLMHGLSHQGWPVVLADVIALPLKVTLQ